MPRFPEPEPLTVATLAHPVGEPADRAAFERAVAHRCGEAAASGARLLVFPEYFPMELAALHDEAVRRSLTRQLAAMQDHLAGFRQLFSGLARTLGVTIVAGSYPVAVAGGRFRNRAYVYFPDGAEDFQDKLMMTRFETELWKVSGGDTLRVFDAPGFRFGVNICYDCEFPLHARRQAEAGARLLVVPSCTDSRAGDWRVRLGARARALENQIYALRAPTVGEAPWSRAIDKNLGAAGIYGPVDRGFPDDGVIAESAPEAPGWLYATLDLARLDFVRRHGQVRNFADWPGQHAGEVLRRT